MAEVSIIVPVYKVEKYIRRCIDSILAQAYEDFELILVDDGSPDDCGNICDEYAKKDSRIVVIHKENGGLSDARNVALDWVFANSQSEYIVFVDSDDWVHSEYLEALRNGIKNTGAEICACAFEPVSFKNYSEKYYEICFKLYSGEDFCVDEWCYSNAAWAKLYPKSFFETLRFPVGKIHEDAFTIYKVLLPCEKLAFIQSFLYCFNADNTESITRRQWTPERMVLLDAIEERIAYCIENNYKKYLNTEVEEYIKTVKYYLHKIEQFGFSEYKKIISFKLRKMLKLRCFKDKYSWRRNIDIYGIAYPKAVRIISILSRVKRKLLKR